MNIIAQVCWFDEPPESLTRLIDSLSPLVDVAVFLDGAYKNFPHTDPVSDDEQYVAIVRACVRNNIIPVVPPGQLWQSQVHKRSAMFAHVQSVALLYEDYTLIIDADEYLMPNYNATRIRHLLTKQRPDVALVALNTPPPARPSVAKTRLQGIHAPRNSTNIHGRGIPRIMRVINGVTVGPKFHGSYVGTREDGSRVCLKDRQDAFKHLKAKPKILDLKYSLEIRNETWRRDAKRIVAKDKYGKARKRLGEDL